MTAALRVLHLLDWPGYGGIESVVISLLIQQRAACVLFLRNGPGVRRFLATGRQVRFVSEFLQAENGSAELAKYCHSFDVLHVHSCYLEPGDILLAKTIDSPTVVTLHSKTVVSSIEFPLVCLSATIARTLRSSYPIYTIENGVTVSQVRDDRFLSRADASPIFMRVCRPERSASNFWPVMERVLEALPFAKLWIVGEEGINRINIRFLGIREDVAALLALADIFVYFPDTHELGAHDLCILEAMAAGLPIVTTDVQGVRESVQHGKTALVLPPEAEESLVTALVTLGLDSEYRSRLGIAARSDAQERFSVERMSSRYEAVYCEVRREWLNRA